MIPIFDNYGHDFQKVVMDGPPREGSRDRLYLLNRNGAISNLFQSVPHTNRTEFPLFDKGYDGLEAITDIGAIRTRQAVIQAFSDDIKTEGKFKPLFQNLHLLGLWHYYQHTSSDSLDKYIKDGEELLNEMGNQGGILSQVSASYNERFPKTEIEIIQAAAKQGYFNYVTAEFKSDGNSRRGVRFDSPAELRGYMQLPREKITNQRVVETDEYFGISPSDLVKSAIARGVSRLNHIYSPLAALYVEAIHLANNGWVLPELNEEGTFEMVNGKPMAPTPNPVGTTIRYDKQSGKLVLNGIHSGGKSHLLLTLYEYQRDAQRGFSVPAESVNMSIMERIFFSHEIQKRNYGGSLASEFHDRATVLSKVGPNDLVLMDEFLQHASPDATTDLEPIILDEFYNTGASVVVVTHRGDSLDDKTKWQFYSPGFKEEGGRIVPTYKFQEGRPDQTILKQHAQQMLSDAINNPPAIEQRRRIKDDWPSQTERDAQERTKLKWWIDLESQLFNTETILNAEKETNRRPVYDDDVPF